MAAKTAAIKRLEQQVDLLRRKADVEHGRSTDLQGILASKEGEVAIQTEMIESLKAQLLDLENLKSNESMIDAGAASSPSKDRAESKVAEEFKLLTLFAKREKMNRDEMTQILCADAKNIKMMIQEPTPELSVFIEHNIDSEDALLAQLPRYEIPKAAFEVQVLEEMRHVLGAHKMAVKELTEEVIVTWSKFQEFFQKLEFTYSHKDKLLEFLQYFFLAKIVSKDELYIDIQALATHLTMESEAFQMFMVACPNQVIVEQVRGNTVALYMKEKAAKEATPDRARFPARDEEKMLDIAEHCFVRIADLLHQKRLTVKEAFGEHATQKRVKDNDFDIITANDFVESLKKYGLSELTKVEVDCLMGVLSKPQLDGYILLNEFALIMENFGIPILAEDEEFENDYEPETKDGEKPAEEEEAEKKEDADTKAEGAPDDPDTLAARFRKANELAKKSKAKNPLIIKWSSLAPRTVKLLRKLARFLLERYMHPREFFGPTIYKELLSGCKQKIEVIKLNDFYLRLKLASIRKKLKEKPEVNSFLAVDGDKFPGLVHVKKLIKTLEIIAEQEQ